MLATANGLKESLGEYWTDGLVILWLKPRSGTRRFNQRPPSTSVREIISSNGGFNLRFYIPVVRRIQHPFAIDGFRGLRAAGGAGARRRCFRGRCSGCRTSKYHACSQQHTGSTNNGVFHGCSLLCIDVQQRKPLSEHPSRFCSLKAGLHLLRGNTTIGHFPACLRVQNITEKNATGTP